MAPESLQPSTGPVPSPQEGPPTRVKFRIRFRKAGDLRLVSHHDLMHIFERTFRRASLPVPTTQGFNPRPKMWFALSLALGIAGLNEVLELELSEALPAEEVQRRLAAQAPPGIDILSVRSIDVRAAARVRRAWLRLPLAAASHAEADPLHTPADGEDGEDRGQADVSLLAALPPAAHRPADLAQRCQAFLNQEDCWIERTRPQRRRINVRAFVSELHARDDGLEMALWISPTGAARPEEVIAALGLTSLLEEGAVLERTDLEITDEVSAALPGNVPDAPALRNAIEESGTDDRDSPDEAPASSRPTAIISNPLSFDS